MNPARQIVNDTSNMAGGAVHLLITEGDSRLMAVSPDEAMEEIRVRATQMSSILEKMLHEMEGHPRWGINE